MGTDEAIEKLQELVDTKFDFVAEKIRELEKKYKDDLDSLAKIINDQHVIIEKMKKEYHGNNSTTKQE